METVTTKHLNTCIKKLCNWILFSILTSVVTYSIYFVLHAYFHKFNGDWGTHAMYGEFGDYLGGTLNPIFGFTTILILIWSIRLQMRELNESTHALKDAAEQHKQILNLQTNTEQRRELEETLISIYKEIEALLDKPFFEPKDPYVLPIPTYKHSDSHIFDSLLNLKQLYKLATVKDPTDEQFNNSHTAVKFFQQFDGNETHVAYKKELKRQLFSASDSLIHLSRIFYYQGVKNYRFDSFRKTVEQLKEYRVITQSEMNKIIGKVQAAFYGQKFENDELQEMLEELKDILIPIPD